MPVKPESLVKAIERDILPTVTLVRELFFCAVAYNAELSRVLSLLTQVQLLDVLDIINAMYPQTDEGWALLPNSRSEYITEEMDGAIASDLAMRQFREDRHRVDVLRNAVMGKIEWFRDETTEPK